MSGAQMSLPSNEIRVYVNVPQRPSPPTNFQAAVRGSTLWLAWRNTYAGGAPTGLAMDVTGGVTATMALPFGEAFTVPAMPNGTFTLRLRALNAAGASNQSSSVTVDLAQQHLRVATGAVELLRHQCGQHRRHVVGAAVGRHAGARLPPDRHRVDQRQSFPITGLGFAAVAPPGTYNLSRALGECVWRPVRATAIQTVVIP